MMNPLDIRVGCPYYCKNKAFLVTAIAREFDVCDQIVVFQDMNKRVYYLSTPEFIERFSDERG